MSLTVVCVFVKGHVPFTAEYVIKLHAMARRFISQPFEFVCLTDRPWKFGPEIRTIPIVLPPKVKGWWAKIECFKPDRFEGRVLYLDLDTLIVADVQAIIDFPAPFALAPHAGRFEGPTDGRQIVKRFNSSVMVWNGGAHAHLYAQWSSLEAIRLHGDQDWIGEQCPQAATFPAAWVPRVSELGGDPPGPDAKVVLCKVPKNLEAAKRWPWVEAAWSAA